MSDNKALRGRCRGRLPQAAQTGMRELPTHYELLVESYMGAAVRMGLSREDVEDAIRNATRFDRRCESCKHSRAPMDVVLTAIQEQRLDIFNRACSVKPIYKHCSTWERLELPIVA